MLLLMINIIYGRAYVKKPYPQKTTIPMNIEIVDEQPVFRFDTLPLMPKGNLTDEEKKYYQVNYMPGKYIFSVFKALCDYNYINPYKCHNYFHTNKHRYPHRRQSTNTKAHELLLHEFKLQSKKEIHTTDERDLRLYKTHRWNIYAN